MSRKFKGYPEKSPYDIPKKRRMSHLHRYAKFGKSVFDYDSTTRRAAFDSYKNRNLPDIKDLECYTCVRQPKHWHHIIHVSRAGVDCKKNLVPLCISCHKRAHRYDPVRPNRVFSQVRHLHPFKKPTVLIEFVPKAVQIQGTEKIIPQ